MTIKKPSKAFIDADVMLFQAASKGEQVVYTYHDSTGNEVARFNSAGAGKKWIEEVSTFGVDFEHGYEGDVKDLTRGQHFEDVGFEECKKAWEGSLKYLLEDINNFSEGIKHTILVSPASGLKNFRYDVGTLNPYKGNRKDTRLPKYLEETRKWVQGLSNVKSPRVRYEIDDVCLAYSQLNGEKGLAVAVDKDVRTASGCWVYHYGDMEEPEYSDPNTVGFLDWDGKKMRGLGYLFLFYQSCCGDIVDGYKGIPKFGPAKAFKLLKDYNNKPLIYMNEIISLCIKEYEKGFGKEYTYKSCLDDKEMIATPFDLFRENLNLAYMVKGDTDSAEKSVLKYLNKENV